ncbi:MAG: hypothetical protein JW981_03390 [Anaerolineae bacterium]|nr:hypothetical protein [Anaerolineae bacterium]
MSEETIFEAEVTEVPQPEKTQAEATEGTEAKKEPKKQSNTSLKDAWKQVESFGETLSVALQGRGNVVMVRINDEALEHLDMLVEAEVTKSRSESAAFLINEGIKANQPLFDRVGSITQQIAELREQLREEVHKGIAEEEL